MYPHSNHSKLNFLAPDNLKGADMLMYEIFRSLGLRVSFRPVAKKIAYTNYEDEEVLPLVGLDLKSKTWNRIDAEYMEETLDRWVGRGNPPKEDYYAQQYDSESSEDEEEPEFKPYIDFMTVHWLNDFGHREPQLTYIAVSALGRFQWWLGQR